jgi:hypothetical protein
LRHCSLLGRAARTPLRIGLRLLPHYNRIMGSSVCESGSTMLFLPSSSVFLSIGPRKPPRQAAKPVPPAPARSTSGPPRPAPKSRVKTATTPIFHGIGAGSPSKPPATTKPRATRAPRPLFHGVGGVLNPGLSLTMHAQAAVPEPQPGLAALPKSQEEIDASWRRAFARVTTPFSRAAREPVAKGPIEDQWDEAFSRARGWRR